MTIPILELSGEAVKCCALCQSLKPLADFVANKNKPDGRMSQCKRCHADAEKRQRDTGLRKPQRVDPEEHRARVQREKADLARQVYAHYGLECACCGTTERLTIDHVDGRGREHKLELFGQSRVSSVKIHRWLVRNGFPDGFQVLCRSCNSSKRRGHHCRILHGETGFDRCSRCEQVYPLSAFGFAPRGGRSGHRSWCRTCMAATDRQRRAS
jgi:hypothetical protein